MTYHWTPIRIPSRELPDQIHMGSSTFFGPSLHTDGLLHRGRRLRRRPGADLAPAGGEVGGLDLSEGVLELFAWPGFAGIQYTV